MARSSGKLPQRTVDDVRFLLRQSKEIGQRRPGYMTHAQIAAECGVGVTWVDDVSRQMNAEDKLGQVSPSESLTLNGDRRIMAAREAGKFPPPLQESELGPEALRALEDISYFARRYYGIVLLPWQEIAAQRIVELLETPYEEYAVVNMAPGSGKSMFFGRILPAWLTVRDRSIRGLMGSATNRLATQMVDQLRRVDFVRARPERVSEREIKAGRVEPESVLGADYGRLRPDVEGALWTREQFEVAQLDDELLGRKEPTWQAFGRDSTFIGQRVDFALWDDLWDVRQVRSVAARDEFFGWFDNTAETRLEPGGLFLLQGQRLAPDDVYAYALSKRADIEYGEMEQIDERELPRRYHHIVFKALDETKLTGLPSVDKKLLAPDAPPWPEGPLLSPARLPYRRLAAIRSSTPDIFSLTYQQDDTNLTETLISPLWLEGGEAPNGEQFVGCLDRERRLREVPPGLRAPISVAMTDPSGTNSWGHLWYLWEPAQGVEGVDTRHVMDIEWRKMSADQFLDYNQRTGEFYGLMEDWYQTSKLKGHPIRYWIVERNAAQRYLLQYDHVRIWTQTRGVQIIAHETGANKADPEYGVSTLAPVVMRGLLRIPWADTTARGGMRSLRALDFTKQLREYGGATKSKDDLVMAAWFFEHKKDSIRPVIADESKNLPRPGFAQAFSRHKQQDHVTGRLFGRKVLR